MRQEALQLHTQPASPLSACGPNRLAEESAEPTFVPLEVHLHATMVDSCVSASFHAAS